MLLLQQSGLLLIIPCIYR